jgi:PleD family two-component response regulator
MADRALYQAKHNGKNRYAVLYAPATETVYS